MKRFGVRDIKMLFKYLKDRHMEEGFKAYFFMAPEGNKEKIEKFLDIRCQFSISDYRTVQLNPKGIQTCLCVSDVLLGNGESINVYWHELISR